MSDAASCRLWYKITICYVNHHDQETIESKLGAYSLAFGLLSPFCPSEFFRSQRPQCAGFRDELPEFGTDEFVQFSGLMKHGSSGAIFLRDLEKRISL